MREWFGGHMKPDFLIIGGIKCGTSSLYRYLNAHPQVLPCKSKEPQLLSTKNPLKLLWRLRRYASLFPKADFHGELEAEWLDLVDGQQLIASKLHKTKVKNEQYLTGEASANTFFRAHPALIKTILPKVKLIMLTRQPSERFFSHYQMFVRFTQEGKKGFALPPLDEFIDQEIRAYQQKQQTKLIHQGIYTNYLPRWEKAFGRPQIQVIATARLSEAAAAEEVMQGLCQFLQLAPFQFGEHLHIKHNQAASSPIPKAAKERLDDFYQTSILQLKEQYGIEF